MDRKNLDLIMTKKDYSDAVKKRKATIEKKRLKKNQKALTEKKYDKKF